MKKIVQVQDIACGADELFLISGPCVIEDESIMLKTAEKLKEVSERMNLPIIYKSSFKGSITILGFCFSFKNIL